MIALHAGVFLYPDVLWGIEFLFMILTVLLHMVLYCKNKLSIRSQCVLSPTEIGREFLVPFSPLAN